MSANRISPESHEQNSPVGNGSDRVGGIVLCGGKSRRMGRSKADLPFGEKSLLRHVVDRVASVTQPVVVVAAAEQELPDDTPQDVLVVRDRRPDRGPLEGLYAGLQAMPAEVYAAFVTSCDSPFLNPDLIRKLIGRLGEHEIAAPEENGRCHPLTAVYRTRLTEQIESLLREDRLRPLFLIEECDSVRVDVEQLRDVDPQLHSFLNMNRPEDYELALRLAGISERPD